MIRLSTSPSARTWGGAPAWALHEEDSMAEKKSQPTNRPTPQGNRQEDPKTRPQTSGDKTPVQNKNNVKAKKR